MMIPDRIAPLLQAPWIFLFPILAIQPIPAQTPNGSLPLKAALELSLAKPVRTSPEALAIEAAIARMEALPGPLTTNPEFRLSQVERWNHTTEREYALRFKTTNPWIYKAKQNTQKHSIELARSQLLAREHEILHQTKILYFQALYAQEKLSLALRWKETSQANLDWNHTLLQSGLTTLPEMLEVQLGASEAARDARDAGLSHQLALSRLLAWIDKFDINAPKITLSTKFADPALGILGKTNQELFNNYKLSHPLPRTFSNQNEVAGGLLGEVEEGNKPWVSFVQAGVSRGKNSWEGDDWLFRLGVEIPVFNQVDKESHAANATHAQALAQLNSHLYEAQLQIKGKLADLHLTAGHLGQTRELTGAILNEVQDALKEDQAGPAPTIPPDSRFRLERGVHRIKSAILDAQYAHQEALLSLEYFIPSLLDN